MRVNKNKITEESKKKSEEPKNVRRWMDVELRWMDVDASTDVLADPKILLRPLWIS